MALHVSLTVEEVQNRHALVWVQGDGVDLPITIQVFRNGRSTNEFVSGLNMRNYTFSVPLEGDHDLLSAIVVDRTARHAQSAQVCVHDQCYDRDAFAPSLLG